MWPHRRELHEVTGLRGRKKAGGWGEGNRGLFSEDNLGFARSEKCREHGSSDGSISADCGRSTDRDEGGFHRPGPLPRSLEQIPTMYDAVHPSLVSPSPPPLPRSGSRHFLPRSCRGLGPRLLLWSRLSPSHPHTGHHSRRQNKRAPSTQTRLGPGSRSHPLTDTPSWFSRCCSATRVWSSG